MLKKIFLRIYTSLRSLFNRVFPLLHCERVKPEDFRLQKCQVFLAGFQLMHYFPLMNIQLIPFHAKYPPRDGLEGLIKALERSLCEATPLFVFP